MAPDSPTDAPAAPPDLIPHLPPVWADVFGEDDFGVFAECEIKGVCFVWRWICPGWFRMGCDRGDSYGFLIERPQHVVRITRGFWMGETPVTQEQWQAVMDRNPSHFKGPQRPVESVSWHDCEEFITSLNSRLPGLQAAFPTEAQWEYACRAGTQAAYNDGSACTQASGKDPALNKLGWYNENSGRKTHAVKTEVAPNAWGLYDMHGNVWEWCRDAWDGQAYGHRADGIKDPETIDTSEDAPRVVRGGSWDDQAQYCRAAFRNWGHPGYRGGDLGVRLSAGQELAEP